MNSLPLLQLCRNLAGIAVVLTASCASPILLHAEDAPLAGQVSKLVAEIKWVEPFDVAKQEAKKTGKPMLVFIGNTESCKDCQAFTNSVCTSQEFVNYAATNLICTRVLSSKGDTKDESWKKSQIIELFNIPNAHVVIITNPDGKRIGELSTAPESIGAFLEDIKTIIAKSVPGGRMKFCEAEMIDKTFVPEKTYTSDPPKVSPEPMKGRYINFMTSVVGTQGWETTRARFHGTWRNKDDQTPEIALKMRKSIAEAFPGARITWAWSWHALTGKDHAELRKLMAQFVKEYGDEITFWPGVYFEDKFNTLEQAKKDLHEGLELVSQMVGNGYRPKSVVAGHMSVEDMKFLAAKEGIHTVQGQIWSQFNVDGQDGDGGIIYPYYPSKDHFLKPAQGPRGGDDFVDMVNVDGWTVDFFAARKRGTGKGYNSRVGIGPIETAVYYGTKLGLREMMHVTDTHFNEETVKRNGYGFLTVNWELSLFPWLGPKDYLPNWLKAVREKYPDAQMLTLGEFGEKWREHNPDNSRINLKFVERGNDMPSEEEGKKNVPRYRFHPAVFCPEMEIRWYFNKDFRLATIQNWKENGPTLVMDYTRYNRSYKEPSGNVIERHWDILDIINQKESRPQDKPKPFSELPKEEQAKILKWYPELNDLKK